MTNKLNATAKEITQLVYTAIDQAVDQEYPRLKKSGVIAISQEFKRENRMTKKLMKKVIRNLVKDL